MSTFNVVLIFLMLPVIVLAANTEPDSIAASDSLNRQVRIYEVFGMDCPGCHGGIEKLADRIPGVNKSEANWEEQELKIWVDPEKGVKDEDIIDAIERANLTPGERKK